MGKPKNGTKRKDRHQMPYPPKGKKGKVKRFWIEDAPENPAREGTTSALTVVITRVELHDDHLHGPKLDVPDQRCDNKSDETNIKSEEEDHVIPLIVPVVEASEGTVQPDGANTENTKHDNFETPFIASKRAPSAKIPPTKFPNLPFQTLPNGDCGDGIVNPFPTSEVADKYWAQRKRFFSRFDHGIRMDKEAWFSVTPEAIANHLATRVVTMHTGTDDLVVLDAFSGCGGNAIAFAQCPEVSLVVCADTSIEKLRLVANNAKVYGVDSNKIVLLHCNACSILESYKHGKRIETDSLPSDKIVETECCSGFKLGGLELLPDRIDTIFLSPPWGGMDYGAIGKRNFDLAKHIQVCREDLSTCNGVELLQLAAKAQRCVLYFLPRNMNGNWIGRNAFDAGYRDAIELEQNVLNGKLKTLTAYFGYTSSSLLRSPK